MHRRFRLSLKPTSYPNPARHSGTLFEVDTHVTSRFVRERLIPLIGDDVFPASELMLMSGAVAFLEPAYIFEWGTHFGRSARVFYESAHAFGISTEIYSIDLPEEIDHIEHPHKKRGMYVRGLPSVQLLQGDGLEESLKIYGKLRGTKQVLFFLDGDHSYASVKRELSEILLQAQGAAILLHDTFYQSSDAGYNTGPYEALSEVIKDRKDLSLVKTDLGTPGMTLLYSSSHQNPRK